jgi:hypothetical protein
MYYVKQVLGKADKKHLKKTLKYLRAPFEDYNKNFVLKNILLELEGAPD